MITFLRGYKMRVSREEERLTCPVCGMNPRAKELKVWDSTLPSGKKVSYGILDSHYASTGYPCEGEGLVGQHISTTGGGSAQ